MGTRVLADGYLEDLVTSAGGPFADVVVGARALSALVVPVSAASRLRGLTNGGAVYAHAPADAATGLAQGVLLRSGAGHKDADVAALARRLFPGVQPVEHDSDAIPLDIDS